MLLKNLKCQLLQRCFLLDSLDVINSETNL